MSAQRRAIAAFVLIALIWGSTWLVIKDQVGTTSPYWTVTWRFVCAALGMAMLLAWRQESPWLPRRALPLVVALGVIQFCLNFQFVYAAERQVTSGLVAVIYALLMVPNALLSRLFLGTPISRRFLGGSVVALVGIGLLMMQEYRAGLAGGGLAGGSVPLGVTLALGGLLSASSANVLQAGPLGRSVPLLPLVGWAMALGALVNALFAFGLSGPPVFVPSVRFWGGVAWLGLAGSVVTFPLYFGLVRQWGAGRAAYNGVLVPVVAMTLSTLFEHYRWTGLAVAGAGLAMAGLLIALSGNSARSPSR